MQGFRAVEDHHQAPIGAQAAALKTRQEALTDSRIFRRPVPHAERVFPARVIDAEGGNDTVLADVDAIDQQRDEIERVEWRSSPGRQLAGTR